MAETADSYRILLDNKWSLEDLNEFSRVYIQNYAFIYCLEKNENIDSLVDMDMLLRDFELRGGLTYVNVYEIFKSHVPKNQRPQINSIQYSSPGWIELALNYDVALELAKSVGCYLTMIYATSTVYKKLHRIYINLMHQRIRSKNEKLKLSLEEAKLVNELNNELAKGLGFKNLAALDDHTKDVEESSKLLMAHFRRVEKMSKFVKNGKAWFPTD